VGTSGYSYSFAWRMTEIVGIVLFFGLLGVTATQAWQAISGPFAEYQWVILSAAFLLAILAADFISGLVHFLADNFGREDMTFLGPTLIHPFREHHVDAKEIARHDWVETNGNNCIICVPWIAVFLLVIPTQDYLAAACWMTFWSFFLVWIMLTNQFHKWSHQDDRAGWVRFLQRCWLVLPEDHHNVHHTDPFDRYYCITVGWLNPILDKLGFWQRLYTVLAPWLPQSERESAHARFEFWGTKSASKSA
jgi:ubiquitin-conjugating enzyme E2 variant